MTRINAAQALIDRSAVNGPDRLPIVGGASRLTHAALVDLTNRIGNVLIRRGCGPGDRVLLAIPDSPELAAALLAAIKVGALAVPVSSAGSADD